MKKQIKIIDPSSKAIKDPLFCVPEDQLEEYLDVNKDVICGRMFQTHPDFVFRKIADEGILVPTGNIAQTFNGMINLNPTSVFLWQLFSSPSSVNEAIANAEQQYEVSASLHEDVLAFVDNNSLRVRELVKPSMIPLAKTKLSTSRVLFTYFTFYNRAEYRNGIITGITE